MHNAFNFKFATDYRIKFSFAGCLCQVATKLIEYQRCRWCSFCWSTGCNSFFSLVTREKLNNTLTYAVKVCAKFYKNLCCNTFAFANKSKKNVFCANVVVAKLYRFA